MKRVTGPKLWKFIHDHQDIPTLELVELLVIRFQLKRDDAFLCIIRYLVGNIGWFKETFGDDKPKN